MPRIITELYWYMSHEEYQAFAPHEKQGKTLTGATRKPMAERCLWKLHLTWGGIGFVSITELDGLKLGYFSNTPIIDQLRKSALSINLVKISYEDYREALTSVGREVPRKEKWGRGWGTTWTARRTTVPHEQPTGTF